MTTTMGVADKASGMLLTREVTISADEGIRADTTYEGGVEDPLRGAGRRDQRRQRQPVLGRRLGVDR